MTEVVLDPRLAFAVGLESSFSRGELTDGRLARRIVRLANLGQRDPRLAELRTPKTEVAVNLILQTTWIAQELLLGGSRRPPAHWEIGHYANLAASLAQQKLWPSRTAVAELGQEGWNLEEYAGDQLGAICQDIAVWGVLKPLVDQGYAKAWGGEWGICPTVRGEADDI